MKKAQVSLLAVLIIVLLIGIPITYFIATTKERMGDTARKESCIISVKTNAEARQGKTIFEENVKCPAKLLTITEKEDNKIKRTLADEMAECWEIFGGGKSELFDEEGVYCAVCSVVDFKDKNKKIGGFSEYLLKTNMRSPRNKLVYADYLSVYKTPNAEKYAEDILSKGGADTTIDTSNTYSTLFIYAKGKDAISDLKDALGGTGKAVAITGLAGGAAGGAIAVFLLGSNPVGWVTAGFIVVGAGAFSLYTYFSGEPPEWMALTTLTEYSEQELDRYKCKILPVEQGNI